MGSPQPAISLTEKVGNKALRVCYNAERREWDYHVLDDTLTLCSGGGYKTQGDALAAARRVMNEGDAGESRTFTVASTAYTITREQDRFLVRNDLGEVVGEAARGHALNVLADRLDWIIREDAMEKAGQYKEIKRYLANEMSVKDEA